MGDVEDLLFRLYRQACTRLIQDLLHQQSNRTDLQAQIGTDYIIEDD